MELILTESCTPSPSERGGRPSATKRWTRLAVCLLGLWAFIFVIAPELRRIEAVDTMAQYVEDSGIEATALYYTEVEETGDAENYLRSALNVRP